MNIDLPEVAPMAQHARFYREGDADLVEISFTGVKDTVIRKVKPEHMASFPEAWASYCDGTPMKPRAGAPLTDLEGVDAQRSEYFFTRNVHNAEELAALHDAQCQALGHGTLTLRKAARELLALRQLKQQEVSRDLVTKASAAISSVPAEKYASESDLAAVKSDVTDIKTMLGQLIAAQEKPKRGRPVKAED